MTWVCGDTGSLTDDGDSYQKSLKGVAAQNICIICLPLKLSSTTTVFQFPFPFNLDVDKMDQLQVSQKCFVVQSSRAPGAKDSSPWLPTVIAKASVLLPNLLSQAQGLGDTSLAQL